MVLTKKQKKELVIRLYEEGKTTREIAKIVKISLRDIGIILREYNKEPEPKPEKSDHARAFQLFSIGKTPTQVAIIVDLSYETVKRWYFEYLSLNNQSNFVNILYQYPEFLPFFIDIAQKMKRGDLFKEEVDYMLANLIYCRASQHRKEWLDHENRCLEAKNKNLVEENTRLENDRNSKLSDDPNRFTYFSEDL
jgi:DNA-binding CsgD family transcriptional regulator